LEQLLEKSESMMVNYLTILYQLIESSWCLLCSFNRPNVHCYRIFYRLWLLHNNHKLCTK